MEFIFLLDEGRRAAFLGHVIQSFGCSYVCIWSHLAQPANCLYFLDGMYQETSSLQQPSSSAGSHARSLFNAYSELINYPDSCRVPGFSFKNNLPYMEFKIDELQRMASSEVQLQFYQEAMIKTAVFMGCASGEIEIGMLHQHRTDLEMEMKNLFTMYFSRGIDSQPADQVWPSSSSSSLRSLSSGSPEYSPLVLSIPTTSAFQAEPTKLKEAVIQESSSFVVNAPKPVNLAPNISYNDPHQQAIQALRQICNVKFPTVESEDDAIQKAILAVLSSPSSTNSSSSYQSNQLTSPTVSPLTNGPTAFLRYTNSLAPSSTSTNRHKHNHMFRRAVVFFRNLNMRRRKEYMIQENRPSRTRLHHMISERRRREKLNEVFQALRSMLGVESKMDKASILSSTTQYLGSLISQVSELSRRNQELETRLSNRGEAPAGQFPAADQDQRLNVEINQVVDQTSEARLILELRVTIGGDQCSMLNLLIRILGLIKQQHNVGLLALESNTIPGESTSVHCVVLKLKIEGDESDVSGLRERITRNLDDMARVHTFP